MLTVELGGWHTAYTDYGYFAHQQYIEKYNIQQKYFNTQTAENRVVFEKIVSDFEAARVA